MHGVNKSIANAFNLSSKSVCKCLQVIVKNQPNSLWRKWMALLLPDPGSCIYREKPHLKPKVYFTCPVYFAVHMMWKHRHSWKDNEIFSETIECLVWDKREIAVLHYNFPGEKSKKQGT